MGPANIVHSLVLFDHRYDLISGTVLPLAISLAGREGMGRRDVGKGGDGKEGYGEGGDGRRDMEKGMGRMDVRMGWDGMGRRDVGE